MSRRLPTAAMWSPMYAPEVRRAFADAWAARGRPELRDRVAELVAAAEAATERELLHRLELAAAGGLDLRDMLTPTALENAREAVSIECRASASPLEIDRDLLAALPADELPGYCSSASSRWPRELARPDRGGAHGG